MNFFKKSKFVTGRKVNFVLYRSNMTKNKLIFLILGALFLIIMGVIGWDMSRKTTFPGSKGNLKERIAPEAEISKDE